VRLIQSINRSAFSSSVFGIGIRPAWLVSQYRHALDVHSDRGYDREGQQQMLRPTFEGPIELVQFPARCQSNGAECQDTLCLGDYFA
jgi:hypothetical protein